MDEKRQKLIETIESLPEDERRAILWLIEHYRFAAELCRECPISPEESKVLEEEAINKNNTFLLVLVLFERSLNIKKSPPEKADS